MRNFIILTWVGLCVLGLYFENYLVTPTVATPQKHKRISIDFKASDDLYQILPQIKEMQDAGMPLNDMFYRLHTDGNKVCDIIHGNYPKTDSIMRAFSPVLFSGQYNKILRDLISGCYNFFRMNDISMDKLVDRINSIYGNTGIACYSVGFSQVYILATRVHCLTISAIDVDWRILWAHYQVMDTLKNSNSIDFSLLNIGWSADFNQKIKPLEHNIGVHTFCYPTDSVLCSQAFKDFPNREINNFEIQLSFLHQMQIKPTPEVVLIYVSNAIDPEYTTKSQFRYFVQSLVDQVGYQKKIVVVYHSGGNNQFGIYEIQRYQPDHTQITTACADAFTWSNSYSNSGTKYQTYFDEISITRDTISCSE